MKPDLHPVLAPPGAGLPAIERFVADWMFRLKRGLGTPEDHVRTFERERARIAELVAGCRDARGAERVLIRRLPGMEDSSRHWSVWMTLEHLRIVNESITGVLLALGAGRIPPGEASTAAVKPPPGVTRAVIPGYEAACGALATAMRQVQPGTGRVRFAHPWFGPLDANGWAVMAGGHMGIHRRQIAHILAGRGE